MRCILGKGATLGHVSEHVEQSRNVQLNEKEICGVKSRKGVQFLTKAEVIRWLKCRMQTLRRPNLEKT